MIAEPGCAKIGCVKLDGAIGPCDAPVPTCTAFPNGIPHKIAYEDAGCPYFSRGIISHGSLLVGKKDKKQITKYRRQP